MFTGCTLPRWPNSPTLVRIPGSSEPRGLVFRLPATRSRCADSHPGLFSQLNRPNWGTTNYEGERGLLQIVFKNVKSLVTISCFVSTAV
jgi:hypothetical protein